MRSAFSRVFSQYNQQVTPTFNPTNNNFAQFFLNDIPRIISTAVNLDPNKFKIESSVGKGKWTETPWISIFDRKITEKASKGFYIVYLFSKDMNGVYLSLNQGTTYIDQKYKNRKPREKMEEVSRKLNTILEYSPNVFSPQKINLVSTTPNSKNYMAAHICGKYYPSNNLPSNAQLIDDLKELLVVYSQLKVEMGRKDIDKFIDYLLNLEDIEDTQFQSDIQLTEASTTPSAPQTVPPKSKSGTASKWKRDPSKAKEALVNAGFACEFNPIHETFESDVTGENFVEAHHLIPMNCQSDFKWSLDVPGNIISLCPNCHRKIHHSKKDEKKRLIKDLYNNRKNILKVFGIEIALDDLIDSYS